MLLDLVKAKALSVDQVSCRALIGTAKVAGKSLVDVLVFKHDLLKYFVNTLPDILGIRPDVKQKLKDITVDIPTYRAAAGYAFNPSFMTVKTTFKAGWPLSADAFFDMVDGTVFGYAYDEAIRQFLKSGRIDVAMTFFVVGCWMCRVIRCSVDGTRRSAQTRTK